VSVTTSFQMQPRPPPSTTQTARWFLPPLCRCRKQDRECSLLVATLVFEVWEHAMMAKTLHCRSQGSLGKTSLADPCVTKPSLVTSSSNPCGFGRRRGPVPPWQICDRRPKRCRPHLVGRISRSVLSGTRGLANSDSETSPTVMSNVAFATRVSAHVGRTWRSVLRQKYATNG